MKMTRFYQPLLLPLAIAAASANVQANDIAAASDRMIVKYAAPMALNSITTDLSLTSAPAATYAFSTSDGAQVVQLDDMTSVEELESLAQEIKDEPGVIYAEPDYIMTVQAMPDDSYYGEQWHYFEAAGGINLPDAWDITTGSADVVVAVVDTGVLPHEDLVKNLIPGYDFISDTKMSNDGNGRDSDASDAGDAMTAGECGWGQPARNQNSSWHGTHVAGTIAADSNNSLGVAGISWNSKILPVRVLGKCGGYTSDITDGMRWAAGLSVQGVPKNTRPAQVINMSLGGKGNCSNAYQSAINDVVATGATVVVAAGNDNDNAGSYTPASCDNVISVAATNRDGGRAYYSNYGSVVDVAAPGGETTRSGNGVLSTLDSGTEGPVSDSYSYYQGTSMAAPHVAGVAALMYSVNPDLSADQVKSILQSTSRSFPSTSTRACTTAQCGSGIIDAAAAVMESKGSDTQPNTNVLQNGEIRTISGARGSNQYFTVEVPEGALALNVSMTGGSGDADLYVRYGSKPTDSNYDCRPWKNGNEEVCDLVVKAGTWHVMVQGYNTFSNVDLVANFDGVTNPEAPEQSEFFNTDSVSIPDNSASGVSSVINAIRSGNAGTVEVTVDVTHSYRGDVQLQLISPAGNVAQLKSKNGRDGAQNVTATYSVDFGNAPANGQWTLKVSDHYAQDTGKLNSWSIKF